MPNRFLIFFSLVAVIAFPGCSGNVLNRWAAPKSPDKDLALFESALKCWDQNNTIQHDSCWPPSTSEVHSSLNCASLPLEVHYPSLRSHADCSPESLDNSFELLFVELDEQGRFLSDDQFEWAMRRLKEIAENQPIALTVFVHGWFGSASHDDRNVIEARETLKFRAQIESARDKRICNGAEQRKTVGIFVGWPGKSIEIPFLEYLTFWDRKSTAHDVAMGGVRELFSRLRQFKKAANDTYRSRKARPDVVAASGVAPDGMRVLCNSVKDFQYDDQWVREVIIAHSFGASVTFNAISENLLDEIVRGEYEHEPDFAGTQDLSKSCDRQSPKGAGLLVSPPADLVLLINPAMEGKRYEAFHQAIKRRARLAKLKQGAPFCNNQFPVLVSITADNDYATKIAFPLGRFFSTALERESPSMALHSADFPGGSDDELGKSPAWLALHEIVDRCDMPKRTGGTPVDQDRSKQICSVARDLLAKAKEENNANKDTVGHNGRYKNLTLSALGSRSYLELPIDGDDRGTKFRVACDKLEASLRETARKAKEAAQNAGEALPADASESAIQLVHDCACNPKRFVESLSQTREPVQCRDAASELVASHYGVPSNDQSVLGYTKMPRLFCGGMMLWSDHSQGDGDRISGPNPSWMIKSDSTSIIDGHSEFHDVDKYLLSSFIVQIYHDQVLPWGDETKVMDIRKKALSSVSTYCAGKSAVTRGKPTASTFTAGD